MTENHRSEAMTDRVDHWIISKPKDEFANFSPEAQDFLRWT